MRYRAIVYICLSHCANITCFCQKKHTHTQRSQRESGASYVVLIAKKERKKKVQALFLVCGYLFLQARSSDFLIWKP